MTMQCGGGMQESSEQPKQAKENIAKYNVGFSDSIFLHFTINSLQYEDSLYWNLDISLAD